MAPGNAGTASLGENLPIRGEDFAGLAEAVKAEGIDLIVVGPEAPLAAGIVDFFEQRGVPIFGPSQRAALIESSKVFAKALMRRHGIPCAESESFDSFEAARAYVEGLSQPPVVKADGLAAGKGVTVAGSLGEALAALEETMVKGAFGEAGRRVVVEERLEGREASVFAFTDGETVLDTVPACDYKRALDSDQGSNTGGMGGYSPSEFLDEGMLQRIKDTVLYPAVRAMAQEGRPYRGVLYVGLILGEGGPRVLEFNCRLGDPETQVILPRMRSDLLEVIEAVLTGRLAQVRIDWGEQACVGVVMASGGYPGPYRTGYPILGLETVDPEVTVFHAGTRLAGELPVTNGGRVLTVVAPGKDIGTARERAYDNLRRISFQDAHYRRDIALRAVHATP